MAAAPATAPAAAAPAMVDRSPSPASDSATSRSTIGQCKSCKRDVGEFYNSWVQVTGSYYLPALVGSYRTSLRPYNNKPRAAAVESSLTGCLIQPLQCQCSETLGIIVCNAPEDKRAYMHRELFKLRKVQLIVDETGREVDAVIVDSKVEQFPARPTANMSVDVVESNPAVHGAAILPPMPVAAPSKPSRPEPPLQPANVQGPTRLMALASQAPSDGIRLPPIAPVANQVIASKPLPQTNGYPQTNGHPANHSHPPHHQQPQAAMYPPAAPQSNAAWVDSRFEAIDRIQAQVNMNRATIEQQMREIQHISQTVATFESEWRKMYDFINALASEVRSKPTPSTPRNRIEDDHFEMLSAQVATAMAKTGEIDTLKLKIAVLERKLKHQSPGEMTAAAAPHPYPVAAMHPAHAQPIVPSNLSTPRMQAEAHPMHNQSVGRSVSYAHPYRPDSMASHETPYRPVEPVEAGAQAGWTSVNTAAKRAAPNGVDSRSEHGTPIGSPKRPRLAPMEPRPDGVGAGGLPTPNGPYDHRYQPKREEELASRTQLEQHPEPPRHPDPINPSTFIPYNADTQTPSQDDHWRQYPQRAVSASDTPKVGSSPRGRGRGRGGRGGRSRKNVLPDAHPLSTPDWDKSGWSGSPGIGEDSYHHHDMTPSGTPRDGFAQADSAGYGQGNRVAIPPATHTSVLPSDPYAHTKKTRTKPIRNSDGVLIRKDGRPDMRSQSSAANLRKVHARKEEEKKIEGESGEAGATPGGTPQPTSAWTPTNTGNAQSASQSHVSSPAALTGSESGASRSPELDNHEGDVSTEERTRQVMKRMFPQGIEEQQSRLMQVQDHFYPGGSKETSAKAEEAKAGDAKDAKDADGDSRMVDAGPANSVSHVESGPPAEKPVAVAVA